MSLTGDNINRPMLVISDDKVPTSAYQAIYHKMTSKVENLREVFYDSYTIKIEDILHLNNIVENTIKQFVIKGQKCEITLSLNKGESFGFSSFEKFYAFNFSTICCTSKIVYDLDFFTIIPVELKDAEDIVQRFKATISIDQDFVEEDEGNVPPYLQGIWAGKNITLKIEYSDYSVARNIQSAVRDWVANLPTEKKSHYRTIIDKYGEFFSFFVPRFFSFGTLIAFATFLINDNYTNQINFPQVIVLSAACAIISQIIGHILIVRFYREISMSRLLTFILITEGDRRRYKKINNRIVLRRLFSNFFLVTICGGIFASIIASYIFIKVFDF